MNDKKIDKLKLIQIILGIAGIILGIFFIKINGQQLFEILAFVLGALTVITNLPGLIRAIMLKPKGKFVIVQIIFSALGVVLGVLLMFFARPVVIIGIGIYMIAFPVFDIIMSPYRSEQLKAEFPKILVGIGMVIIGPGQIVDVLINIIGVILIILSVYFLFITFESGIKRK